MTPFCDNPFTWKKIPAVRCAYSCKTSSFLISIHHYLRSNKITTETFARLLENLVLHHCACLRSSFHSLGRNRGACLSAQCGVKHSEGLCWQSCVDRLQDKQTSGPWRDARLQRAGKIGKNIDFDILSLYIFKE